MLNDVVQSKQNTTLKLERLEELWFKVVNEHPDGFAAKVLDQISNTQTSLMYPNWKGGTSA